MYDPANPLHKTLLFLVFIHLVVAAIASWNHPPESGWTYHVATAPTLVAQAVIAIIAFDVGSAIALVVLHLAITLRVSGILDFPRKR